MTLDISAINWIAVLAGAAIYFILGAAWYSPILFARPWQEAIGWDESRAQPQANPLTYVVPASSTCSPASRRPCWRRRRAPTRWARASPSAW